MEEQAHQAKYDQRLLELSLLEVLGDDAPPDLVDETLAEYEARKLGSGRAVSIETARRGRKVSAAGIALFAGGAIAASLVIAIGLYAFGDTLDGTIPGSNGVVRDDPTNEPDGSSGMDEPKDDLPPVEDDPVELQRQELHARVSKQLIGISGSSWKLDADNRVLLEQGWFLAHADSPTLVIGKTAVSPVDGVVLIYVGEEFPEVAAIKDALRQFDVLGYPLQFCQFRPIDKRESWFSNKDCSAYLLSGSVVCNREFYQLGMTECPQDNHEMTSEGKAAKLKEAAWQMRSIGDALRERGNELLEEAKATACPKTKQELKEQAKVLFGQAWSYEYQARQYMHKAEQLFPSEGGEKDPGKGDVGGGEVR